MGPVGAGGEITFDGAHLWLPRADGAQVRTERLGPG